MGENNYNPYTHSEVNKEMVEHPNHYNQGKYECLDVAMEIAKEMEGNEAILFFNSFKYLWRYNFKNGVEDLEKCRFYLNELIKLKESSVE